MQTAAAAAATATARKQLSMVSTPATTQHHPSSSMPPDLSAHVASCIVLQAVQAAQLTFEDFFMADLAMAPLKIVGFEGVFGSIMMLCVLLPVAYFLPGPEGYGLHENTLDTLAMIKSSKGLQVREVHAVLQLQLLPQLLLLGCFVGQLEMEFVCCQCNVLFCGVSPATHQATDSGSHATKQPSIHCLHTLLLLLLLFSCRLSWVLTCLHCWRTTCQACW